MRKKHILVFSQYFYPEQFRINDICSEWIKRGHRVTVVTGIPNYPSGKFYKGYNFFRKKKDTYNGVDVIRIPIVPRGKNPIMLTMNYLSFVMSGFFWSKFTNIKSDIVFTYEVSPMTQALPAVWYAKRNHLKHFLYCLDLWPENVEILSGLNNNFFLSKVGSMVDYVYKNSDKIFVSSKSFISSMEARNVQKEKIYFWPQYAESFYKPIKLEEKDFLLPSNTLNITFAGNIGYAQGLDILILAAIFLKEHKYINIKFNIIGDGRYKKEFKKKVVDNELDSFFLFIEKKPPEEIPMYLAQSDLSFISFKSNPIFNKTIPAKLQSSLACGIPILVSADGELRKLVSEYNCGLVSPAGDSESLYRNIIKYKQMSKEAKATMKTRAIFTSKTLFDKEGLLDKMDSFLEET